MLPWAREQLQCPGAEKCGKTRRAIDACRGCPRDPGLGVDDDTVIEYVSYLVEKYAMKTKGFDLQFPGFEPLYITYTLSEMDQVKEMIHQKKQEEKKR